MFDPTPSHDPSVFDSNGLLVGSGNADDGFSAYDPDATLLFDHSGDVIGILTEDGDVLEAEVRDRD